MPTYPFKYVEDGDGKFLPITHLNAVRDSEGNTLPEILDRDYPTTSKSAVEGSTEVSLCTRGEKFTWNNKLGSEDVDSTIPSGTSSKVPTSDAVKAYVASVMINPISDSNILNSQSFAVRDCVNVNGTMYLCDAATSDYPVTPITQGNDIVVDANGFMVVSDNTISSNWHSF